MTKELTTITNAFAEYMKIIGFSDDEIAARELQIIKAHDNGTLVKFEGRAPDMDEVEAQPFKVGFLFIADGDAYIVPFTPVNEDEFLFTVEPMADKFVYMNQGQVVKHSSQDDYTHVILIRPINGATFPNGDKWRIGSYHKSQDTAAKKAKEHEPHRKTFYRYTPYQTKIVEVKKMK